MHELLLFGQIPAARHEQLLNILAGLSAMQPQRVLERHVLFKPARIPQVTGAQKGGSQGVATGAPKQNQQASRNANTDVFYVHLVKPLAEAEFGKSTESMDVDRLKKGEGEGDWQLRFKDTPQPGKKPTILRGTETTDIKSGDPQAYVEALGYGSSSPTSFNCFC
jgi:mediator of RNA polymerase II transcription subunit 18